jgi:hypothetical protein
MHNCTPLITIVALFAIGQAPLTSGAAGKNKREVFSWWTSGSEAAASQWTFDEFFRGRKYVPYRGLANALLAPPTNGTRDKKR